MVFYHLFIFQKMIFAVGKERDILPVCADSFIILDYTAYFAPVQSQNHAHGGNGAA